MAIVTVANSDPRASDNTPRVSIFIDSTSEEFLFVEEYSIDQDVLNIGDPFRVVLPNIDGRIAGKIKVGALVKLYMQSPDALNTGKVQKAIGRVTSIDSTIDAQGGGKISIGGADLGWHLRECHADIWRAIPGGIDFGQLIERTIGAARLRQWNISGVEYDNIQNKKINQGRAGVERTLARKESADRTFIPPMQVEPGQCAAEFLTEYARRAQRFINVSSDGYIQFFRPDDNGPAEYQIRLYKSDSPNRNKGNVKSAKANWSIDGIVTKAVCVGTVVQLSRIIAANQKDPNRARFRGQYDERDDGPIAESALPFPRTFYFADGDQLSKAAATARARWKLNRGRFDSFSAEYTVANHTQNGLFWVPDSCVDVVDEINGIKGKFYISAVRYSRTREAGTTTTITIHEAGVLSA